MAQQIRLTFLAVHAHPNDEVFGTGGTFTLLTEQGVHTVLVTATWLVMRRLLAGAGWKRAYSPI